MKASLVIGIVAPSGYITDLDALNRAGAWFAARGHRVVIDDVARLRWQRFAGSDAERIDSLHRMFRREDVDVVMAARGGYGLSRMLDGIDYVALAQSGKPFVGHSDCTALQLALLARADAPSLAGPTACFDFGGQTVSEFTERCFWSALSSTPKPIVVQAPGQPPCAVTGVLWGGNLRTVTHLVGTPWFPAVEGGILFLEDVYEHPYRIERMLLQLHYSGVLDRQAAILMGDFSGYKLQDNDGGYNLATAIEYIRGKTRAPVLTGLPFGHTRDKVSLPIGGSATLTSSREGWQLAIPPPSGAWRRLQ